MSPPKCPPKRPTDRIDVLLVERALAATRHRAQALLMAGVVRFDGQVVTKAGQRVPIDGDLRVMADPNPFVSRGGLKLRGALDALGLDVAGLRCLDVGASTGGFTDCLLQRGAVGVIALDVGHGLLDARIRADPRVTVREKANARHLDVVTLPYRVDLITIDVSFISLALVLPAVRAALSEGSRAPVRVLAMVKPQFEVGRGQVGPGGVVTDDALRWGAVDAVVSAAATCGLRKLAAAESEVSGPKGNREIFVAFALDAGAPTAC